MKLFLVYVATIWGLLICSSVNYLNDELLFVSLNITYSIYIFLLLVGKLRKGMSIINPIIVATVFMFLLSYGFPVLFQYFNYSEIRYLPKYSTLVHAMLYANVGFLTLWYTYNSSFFDSILSNLNKYSKWFVKNLKIRKQLIYFFLFLSILFNLNSIYSGNYGVLATIYADENSIGIMDQVAYFFSTALKGIVFLQAWQYFKYNIGKKMFICSFFTLLFFQLLSGYKGAVVLTFIILFVANYFAVKKVNIKLGVVCFFALVVAYGIVNPYRDYLVYSGNIPSSISDIISCIYNGVVLQSQVISNEDVSVLNEVMSRFTTLPELALFIEYKEKLGLHVPRDPDFFYLCYTIPAQLLVPRFLWPSKPVNDLGVWWVSNTVTGNMSNSSSPFGPIGFLYLTYDVLAIVIGFIIISFMLKLCSKLLQSKRDGAVLVGIILLSSLYVNEAGFNTYVIGGIRFLFIGIIFQIIILRRA